MIPTPDQIRGMSDAEFRAAFDAMTTDELEEFIARTLVNLDAPTRELELSSIAADSVELAARVRARMPPSESPS